MIQGRGGGGNDAGLVGAVGPQGGWECVVWDNCVFACIGLDYFAQSLFPLGASVYYENY